MFIGFSISPSHKSGSHESRTGEWIAEDHGGENRNLLRFYRQASGDPDGDTYCGRISLGDLLAGRGAQKRRRAGKALSRGIFPRMDDFAEFMRRAANRIATSQQTTPGVEGYVFDGADGSQMAFWTCHQTAASASHAHDYDEYMFVVQGCYTLIIGGNRIPVKAGREYLIPRGTPHAGEVVAGTRTIHAFDGHRADRMAR